MFQKTVLKNKNNNIQKEEENWSGYFRKVLSLAITSTVFSLEITPMTSFSLQSVLLSGIFLEFSLNK